jgi:hypothetical protein
MLSVNVKWIRVSLEWLNGNAMLQLWIGHFYTWYKSSRILCRIDSYVQIRWSLLPLLQNSPLLLHCSVDGGSKLLLKCIYYQCTLRHISEALILYQHRCDSVKFVTFAVNQMQRKVTYHSSAAVTGRQLVWSKSEFWSNKSCRYFVGFLEYVKVSLHTITYTEYHISEESWTHASY